MYLIYACLKFNSIKDLPSSILIDTKRFPIQAVQYLKKHQLGSKLGVQFDWGGYAIWHLYPSYLVSIDGRYASVYGHEYSDLQINSYKEGDINGFVGSTGINTILVARNSKLESSLLLSLNWQHVFQDPVASIFKLSKIKSDLTIINSFPNKTPFP